MSDLTLQILKYASTALAVGLAFASTWLFEFTQTNRETGRRSLTRWGRRAIVVAVLSLGLAALTTVWSDRLAADRTAAANVRIEKEKQQNEQEKTITRQYQLKSENLQTEIQRRQSEIEKLLQVINNNVATISPQDKEKIEPIIRSISSPEELKKAYPDLYAAYQANPVAAITEAAERNVKARLLQTENCKDVSISSDKPASYALDGAPVVGIGFWPNLDGIELSHKSLGDHDVSQGYRFVFADGTESPPLVCRRHKSKSSCSDSTNDATTKVVFRMLQEKPVSSIKSHGLSLTFKPGAAERFRHDVSCLVP